MKELRISTFAYELLRELNKHDDLTLMLKEFTHAHGTNFPLDYHWADITDEQLLLAKLKYMDTFKYITVKDKQ
jgi:hypothetical protein